MERGSENGRERRQYKRVSSTAVLVYRPIKESFEPRGSTQYIPADSCNVSLGGLLFSTSRELELGCELKLRVRLFDVLADGPGWNPDKVGEVQDLVATGEVVRVERASAYKYDVAVRFTSFVQGDLEALSKFIDGADRL